MKVGIFGAGTIGTYIGVQLSAAGCGVVLLRRRALAPDEVLAAVSLDGRQVVPSGPIEVVQDPRGLADADLCLVTVKSRDTETAATTLASVLPASTVVVSLQNGLHNAETLARHLEGPVVAGVVTYNAYAERAGRIRKATKGDIYVGIPPAPRDPLDQMQACLREQGEGMKLRGDMPDVLAGKLLLNLNNGVCAATGVGIAESIRNRETRRAFALSIREGLSVMRAAGVRPAKVAALGPRTIAFVMSMPDWVVMTAAKTAVSVVDEARSSTLQDLERGKPTEIDDLNGAIVEIARSVGRDAPMNRTIVEIVRSHEATVRDRRTPSFVSPTELLARMHAADVDSKG